MHSSNGLLLPSPLPPPPPPSPPPPSAPPLPSPFCPSPSLPRQVDNNYRLEVKVLKKYHGHLIGKGGANLQKVSVQWGVWCGVVWCCVVWCGVGGCGCQCVCMFVQVFSMACKYLPVAMATLTASLCFCKSAMCTRGRQHVGRHPHSRHSVLSSPSLCRPPLSHASLSASSCGVDSGRMLRDSKRKESGGRE